MREYVFSNPSARLALEGILHPLIRETSICKAQVSMGVYVIFAIPILIEVPIWQGMGQRILVVDCPESLQIERVIERSHLSAEQVKAIMAAQATRSERLAKADDVIVNDDGIEGLIPQVDRLHRAYKEIAKQFT